MNGFDREAIDVPSFYAYSACTVSHQYTIRGVSPELDAELRAEAAARGTSLNAVVIGNLERVKLRNGDRTDLDWFIGDGPAEGDPEVDAAMAWLDDVSRDL